MDLLSSCEVEVESKAKKIKLLPTEDSSTSETVSTNQTEEDEKNDLILNKNEDLNEIDSEKQLEGDAYLYTRTGRFTSEIFKIEINNLPKYMNIVDLKKVFRNKVKVNPLKLKIIKNEKGKAIYGFATFRNEKERTKVIEIMNGMEVKKCQLRVHKAKPMKDPFVQKKEDKDKEPEVDYSQMSESELHKLIYDRICPLWNLPYEQQLAEKQQDYQNLLTELITELKELYSKTDNETENREQNKLNAVWLETISTLEIDSIRFHSENTGYRNKCEFSLGTDRVVGFRLNAYKDGSLKVIAPGPDCVILPQTSLKMRKAFEEYVQNSQLLPMDGFTQSGHWKALTVRIGSNGCMLIAQAKISDLSEEVIEKEKASLKSFFSNYSEVVSMYFNNQLVFGSKHIEQQMDNNRLRFQISPVSFFQINVKAAEVCYRAIGELLQLDQNVFLLDVCCGTGTIGLFLADRVRKVLGVELNKEAVRDANVNAQNNRILNTEFVAGSAETQINVLIQKAEKIAKDQNLPNLQIVAVLDPPRAGLNKSLIRTLRNCSAVQKLVYVSCEPKLAKQNLIDLCRPMSKVYAGSPFRLTKAIPIDMFPHSRQCELLLLYERPTV